MNRNALIVLLCLIVLGQTLMIAGVYVLAGTGWALVASSVLPIVAAAILSRGVLIGALNESG